MHKTDKNQAEIVQALRASGVQVIDLSAIKKIGVPDILACVNGRSVFIEIKQRADSHISRGQLEFFANAQGTVGLAMTLDEALDLTEKPSLGAFWSFEQNRITAFLIRNPECKSISVKRFRSEILES